MGVKGWLSVLIARVNVVMSGTTVSTLGGRRSDRVDRVYYLHSIARLMAHQGPQRAITSCRIGGDHQSDQIDQINRPTTLPSRLSSRV